MTTGPLKIKHHSLTGRITLPVMATAFRNVATNNGVAGVDQVSIDLFQANLDQNLLSLMAKLKDRSYQPLPVRRAYIPKPQGGQRPLGIPAVRDRIAQDVVRQLLEPLLEPRFHDDSYGFRPGRNCHQAMERVLSLWRQGHRWVLDADIQGFFDNIPHGIIMAGLTEVVADGNILGLVERFLKAGVMEQGTWSPTKRGTAQGGVVSPLLANIALNFLDWHLHGRGYAFVRYADDFVVLCRTQKQAQTAHADIQHYLTTRLGLSFSSEKTRVIPYKEGFDFLGFHTSAHTVTVRSSSVEKLKTTLRQCTQRSHNLDPLVVKKLNQVLTGWSNYFVTRFTRIKTLFEDLDGWLRMRIRCMRFGRKSRWDNRRWRTRHLARMGLLSLTDLRARILSRLAARAPPQGATV